MHEPGGERSATGATRTLEVYRRLKQQILALELPPGQLVTEAELAHAFGISKTPVREALSHLQHEALVEVVGRSGYRVTPLTLKQARELFGLRTVLEGEAAALAAERSLGSPELHELERLAQVTYDPSDPSSVAAFLELNTELHCGIAVLGGNERLAGVLHGVLQELERFFRVGLALTARSAHITHEHSDVADAIAAGNPEVARQRAVSQCVASQEMVLGALALSDSLATANIAPPPLNPSGWH
jgi:DNA-binding GntR family transcriptional regulator